MIFTYYEIKKLPVVVIDQFYSNDACDRIWHELCFLNNNLDKLRPPENTGSAWKKEGDDKIYLKQNSGIFLDEIYNNHKVSDILVETGKIFSPEIIKELVDRHTFFKYVKDSNADKTLLSYYESSDQYLSHSDLATVTCVSWFFKKPKSFQGGELVIEDTVSVECFNNRVIIFPSMLDHAVIPVTMEEEMLGQNYGRYSITRFISARI
jgi:hypothetical protein